MLLKGPPKLSYYKCPPCLKGFAVEEAYVDQIEVILQAWLVLNGEKSSKFSSISLHEIPRAVSRKLAFSPFASRRHHSLCHISLLVQDSGPRGHMTRQEVQGLSPFTRNEGRAKLLAKNRQTFILQTTKLTRIARRVCEDILQPHRAARRPYASINANAVKAECTYTCRISPGCISRGAALRCSVGVCDTALISHNGLARKNLKLLSYVYIFRYDSAAQSHKISS